MIFIVLVLEVKGTLLLLELFKLVIKLQFGNIMNINRPQLEFTILYSLIKCLYKKVHDLFFPDLPNDLQINKNTIYALIY